jgi:hypothetical protein
VQLRRRFGWMAKLSPGDRVFLAMDAAADRVRVRVNGVSLNAVDSQETPARFDITSLLQPRNEAVVEIDESGIENVRLEVYSN